MELSEHIRENIRKMLEEVGTKINIPPLIRDMLTQICYEMYKHGLKDGYRMCITTLEVGKKNIDK